MNKTILCGTVGKDPEIRTAGSAKVATFSLATPRKWKDKDGNPKSETQWHRLVAWEGLATVCENYIKKGNKVLLEGEIHS